MKPNPGYILEFLVGAMATLGGAVILFFGRSSGFVFKSVGAEAYTKGALYLLIGVPLICVSLLRKDNPRVSALRPLSYLAALFSVEFIARGIFHG